MGRRSIASCLSQLSSQRKSLCVSRVTHEPLAGNQFYRLLLYIVHESHSHGYSLLLAAPVNHTLSQPHCGSCRHQTLLEVPWYTAQEVAPDGFEPYHASYLLSHNILHGFQCPDSL